jgi:putative hydrolase of the HAD superfamily
MRAMTRTLTTIGFDADDTLWHNEGFFQISQARFAEMLAAHGDEEAIAARLLETSTRNLAFYGFGIKSFTLSLIETAIEVTEGRVETAVIADILAMGREMLGHPVETLPGVREALEALADDFRFVLITKGDLLDQERKLAASGLGEMFDGVEIVSRKDADTYRRAFSRHGDGPERAMMVGNSLKSDVLPAIAAGAWGVHIPYHVTWALEHAEAPGDEPRFRALESLAELPALVRAVAGSGGMADVTLG